MDSYLLNKAKEIAEQKLTGGSSGGHADKVPPPGKPHGAMFPIFAHDEEDDDDEKTAERASKLAGPSGSSTLFASILGSITETKKSKIENDEDSDIDEEYAVKKHKKNFKDEEEDDDDDNDDRSLGTAAAVEALKMFSQGQSAEKKSQSAFMALAMAQATKLFDDKASQGKVSPSASKESTVQKAGEMALKMYLQSQGKKKGGSAGFGSLVSKFL